jgi:hypothetical protein
MKKLVILSFTIFLVAELFAQQTSTAAIKQTINTMMDAIRKGDSTLLGSVLAKDLQVQNIADDKIGKVLVSTSSRTDLLTAIGTSHADVYDERIVFGNIKVDGPLASVWASSKFYVGATFDHCGVDFFQLARIEDSWKIIYLAYTSRRDNCTP